MLRAINVRHGAFSSVMLVVSSEVLSRRLSLYLSSTVSFRRAGRVTLWRQQSPQNRLPVFASQHSIIAALFGGLEGLTVDERYGMWHRGYGIGGYKKRSRTERPEVFRIRDFHRYMMSP